MFFALWPGEALQRSIAASLSERIQASGGRPIPWQNYHVTLAFLGGLDADQVQSACACAAQIRASSCTLIFDELESWGRSGVLALTGRTLPELAVLLEQLRISLLKAQFEVQHEDFRPHVTLARNVKHRIRREPAPPVSWRVDEFTLVESQTSSSGSRYAIVERWPLSSRR